MSPSERSRLLRPESRSPVSGYRRSVPLTTISICGLPHREHTRPLTPIENIDLAAIFRGRSAAPSLYVDCLSREMTRAASYCSDFVNFFAFSNPPRASSSVSNLLARSRSVIQVVPRRNHSPVVSTMNTIGLTSYFLLDDRNHMIGIEIGDSQ